MHYIDIFLNILFKITGFSVLGVTAIITIDKLGLSSFILTVLSVLVGIGMISIKLK